MRPIATAVIVSSCNVPVLRHTSLSLFLCVLGICVICAKTAEPIEMPFGSLTHMDPRNHVLDWGSDPLTGVGTFSGGGACRPDGDAVHC